MTVLLDIKLSVGSFFFYHLKNVTHFRLTCTVSDGNVLVSHRQWRPLVSKELLLPLALRASLGPRVSSWTAVHLGVGLSTLILPGVHWASCMCRSLSSVKSVELMVTPPSNILSVLCSPALRSPWGAHQHNWCDPTSSLGPTYLPSPPDTGWLQVA